MKKTIGRIMTGFGVAACAAGFFGIIAALIRDEWTMAGLCALAMGVGVALCLTGDDLDG